MTADVFHPVRDAYRLWLRTAPQLTLEVDDLTSLPDAETTAAPERSLHTRPVSRRPAEPSNSNGTRRPTCPGSAAGASQERL